MNHYEIRNVHHHRIYKDYKKHGIHKNLNYKNMNTRHNFNHYQYHLSNRKQIVDSHKVSILRNIYRDKAKLKKTCIFVEKMVQDVERDNIGNEYNSKLLIDGFIHDIHSLHYEIPDSLINLCFQFYFVSQSVIIAETLKQIEIGFKIIKIYDDHDRQQYMQQHHEHKTKSKKKGLKIATLNQKYKRHLQRYKERLNWCQIW